VENQTKRAIKVIRSENGLKYCSKEFKHYPNSAGIIHQKSNPYTPEQNGLCERFNCTVVEKARCLLFDANLGKVFWGYPDNIKVYRIYNPETRTGFTSRDVFIIEPEINSECMIQVQDQNVASVGGEVKPEQQGHKF
ncbi:jg14140, partial [Pararge aegeria aegeria]